MVELHRKVIELSLKVKEVTGHIRAPALRIYTDMQYDNTQISGQRHDEVIDAMYGEVDLVRGTTYCWNLRGDTDTMDSPYDKKNVQQLGGRNPGMIALFCEGELNEQPSTWDTCLSALSNYSDITDFTV